MGQDPGTVGTPVGADAKDPGQLQPVGADAKDPDQLREDIEETRRELGDTVEALAAKTDVKARVHERIDATKESVAEKIGKAREASPDSVSSAASQATTTARQNPIPSAAIGAFAAGFVLGRLTKRG